ncbi:unnamed protein product [Heligmosomoides polygyrus]|uniref:Reverse transcriptase n=1 Tax=Heligmosomoides polygyrus TaxID=6339 RepID=A0A183GB26_HELPZ|nr:unnamed protein product [Heligmosomoides polygyrus]
MPYHVIFSGQSLGRCFMLTMYCSLTKTRLSSSGRYDAWCDRLEKFGLKLHVKKTEYLTTDEDESSSIRVNGIELPRTSVFKYLRSAIASDGGPLVEANSCVSAVWSKWRSLTVVLCDKRIPEWLSKIYRALLRLVAIYGAECWPVTKEIERRFGVMKTKMLWTVGVTRLDRLRNDSMRQRFGVTPIVKKLRETRLRWYGHVIRANVDTVRKTGLNLEVSGKRPRRRRRQRCLRTLHQDLKTARLHADQAFDREKWRQHSRRAEFICAQSAPFKK